MYQVNWAELQQAASDVKNAEGQLDQELSDIGRNVNTLTANWDGAAQQDYANRQTAWNNTAGDIKNSLNALVAAINKAAELAAEGEARAAQAASGMMA